MKNGSYLSLPLTEGERDTLPIVPSLFIVYFFLTHKYVIYLFVYTIHTVCVIYIVSHPPRESYSLAAGLALGLVTLGMHSSSSSSSSSASSSGVAGKEKGGGKRQKRGSNGSREFTGLADLELENRLQRYMLGGKEYTGEGVAGGEGGEQYFLISKFPSRSLLLRITNSSPPGVHPSYPAPFPGHAAYSSGTRYARQPATTTRHTHTSSIYLIPTSPI